MMKIEGGMGLFWYPVNCGYEVDWPDDYSCTGVLYKFTKALARLS
jgi:hypothetical protein